MMVENEDQAVNELMEETEARLRQLLDWQKAHPDATLAEIEAEVSRVRRGLMGKVIEDLVVLKDRERIGSEQILCEGCGRPLKSRGGRDKQVETTEGLVRISRAYYYCSRCKRGFFPLDKALALGRDSWSEGVKKGVTRLGAELPYASAAETYTALTGVPISAKSVELIRKKQGEALGRALAQERAQAMAEEIAAPGPERAAKRKPWGVSVDGTTVHTREGGWKEVKVGAVFHFESRREEVKATELSYVAGLWPAEAVGEALWAETRKRGIDTVYEDVAVGIGDGAVWIWNLMEHHYPSATQVVDWYHAAERLWQVGQAVYGPGTAKTEAWVQARLNELWAGDVERVCHALDQLKPRRREVREAVRQAGVYCRNQGMRMQYPLYREKGYPIGSGTAEGACKNLVGARLKRGGMRWSDAGAQAVLNLRTELLSNRWDEAWRRIHRFQ
jgi:hypothetical protein